MSEIESKVDAILEEMDRSGPEVLYVRLHLTEPNECMGANVARLYTRVLERISEMSPGDRKTACIRDCAARIAAIKLCGECWRPIDRLLRQLIEIWGVPIQ